MIENKRGSLIVTLTPNNKIVIGEIEFQLIQTNKKNEARMRVVAPKDVKINRQEAEPFNPKVRNG